MRARTVFAGVKENLMSVFKITLTAASAIAFCATTAHARDNVHAAGSSTVLPYATIVAEAFGENFDFPTPLIESGGSGAGRKKMCEGVGTNTTDIANHPAALNKATSIIAKQTVLTKLWKFNGYDDRLCKPARKHRVRRFDPSDDLRGNKCNIGQDKLVPD